MTDEVKPPISNGTPPESTPEAASPVAKVEDAVEEVLEDVIIEAKKARPLVVWSLRLGIALLTLTTLGTGALLWRVSQGPLDARLALPLIEKTLGHGDRLKYDIGELTIAWKGRGFPLDLEMQDVHLIGPRGEFITVERASLGLSPFRLLIAQLHFSYAHVDNLALRIIRLPDGAVTVTGSDKPEAQKAESAPLDLSTIVGDLPDIDRLTLSNMRVIFEDQREALVRRFEDVNVAINQTGGAFKRSLNGYMTGTLSGISDGSNATVDFVYEAEDKTLLANLTIDNADTRALIGGVLRQANLPMIDMRVKGRADIKLKNDFSLDSMSFHLQGDDGDLIWPRSYGEGLENQKLTQFNLQMGFVPEIQALELTRAAITIKGITLEAKGQLMMSDNWNKLEGQIDADIPVLAVDALPAVWPKVWDSGAREWLVDRMHKGRFSHINVEVPLTVNRVAATIDPDIEAEEAEAAFAEEDNWDIVPGSIKSTFEFTGITVDYRDPLEPAVNTTGRGRYEGLALDIDIDSAKIGGLNVTGGTLEFDDLITPGTGKAELHFDMNGSVKSVFDYLEKEPIAFRKKVSLNTDNAKGDATIDLKIDFPTHRHMQMEDVHVNANAKLTDLNIPGVAKGLSLSGGPFDLEASENHFKLSGSGQLQGQPITLMWHELFAPKAGDAFSSSMEADIKTTKDIRQKFIGTLEDRIDDAIIPAKITIETKPGGKSTLNATVNLDAARVDFTDPFNAVKEKGAPSTVKITATLQNGDMRTIDTISASGAGLSIASGNLAFNQGAKNEMVLSKAFLKGLRIGANNVDLDATWKSENDITATLSGTAFDARYIKGAPTTSAKGTAESQAKPPVKQPMNYNIKLNLAQLYLADRPLENVTGDFLGNTGGTISHAVLDASIANAPVMLRYDSNQLTLRADDAGRALSAFGITDRVRGGTLSISSKAIPKGQPGDMKGKLTIKDFAVTQAPVLAKLVNLLSLPGILNLLNQDTGLHFSKAESELTFLNRNGGGFIQFKDGSTSGSSLGLTFEGSVDMAKGTTDLQGTVVPMSEMNSLVSSIPLVGDILTGGAKGSGIFAATYSITGPSANPDVSINPLSVLAPGILRRILFEGALTGGSKTAP